MEGKIKRSIRGWFEAYALDMGHDEWSITEEGIDKVAAESAAEIVKLWEADKAGLLAQVAEMRRWLKPIHELCEHYKDKPGLEKEAYAQIYRLAGYALSAAPEARDDEKPKP